jgi:hypothetical protein
MLDCSQKNAYVTNQIVEQFGWDSLANPPYSQDFLP